MSQNLFDTQHRNFENYYEQNKNKPWYDWLVIDDKNDIKNGKQGYTGLLTHPNNKKLCCIYKTSKEDDNVVEHEYKILKHLETLANYCPHFHQAYGIIPFECNLNMTDEPLIINPKYKRVNRDMLLMQYIHNRCNFRQLMEDKKLNIGDNIIINIMKQISLIIHMYNDHKFTHYDLHTENILIRDCNPNMFILYIINKRLFLLPTYGYIPNIIDFGFSYCDYKPINTLTCTLVHTKYGFTSERFDPYTDLKLFFISTVDDISEMEDRNNLYDKLSNMSRNIFSGMNIQWTSGWDNSKIIDPVLSVRQLVKDYVKNSLLFSNSDIWVDTIQLLIDIPLSKLPYHQLETSFQSFIEEFIKFEERTTSKTLLNYILKIFVKYVKQYRVSYISENVDENKWAVLEIKRNFLDEYTQILNYHIPDIDYDKMICSLLLMSQCIEGLFYENLQKKYEEKDKQYSIMRLKSPLEFYDVLNINFPVLEKERKQITNKSSIIVVDHDNMKSCTITLSKEEFQMLNRIKTEKEQTRFIYNVYISR